MNEWMNTLNIYRCRPWLQANCKITNDKTYTPDLSYTQRQPCKMCILFLIFPRCPWRFGVSNMPRLKPRQGSRKKGGSQQTCVQNYDVVQHLLISKIKHKNTNVPTINREKLVSITRRCSWECISLPSEFLQNSPAPFWKNFKGSCSDCLWEHAY